MAIVQIGNCIAQLAKKALEDCISTSQLSQGKNFTVTAVGL